MNTIKVELDQLYFDPNNYRLRNSQNFKLIPSASLTLSSVQKKTQNIITGKNNREIVDLIESFKSNGFLKVDNILVREVSKGKYLIIEGNRRIATLKYFKEKYESDDDIGKIDPKLLKEIEVVLYNYKDEKDYLILMGLKHVSGNKKWERYNQAKLLYELKNLMNLDEGEIASKLGIPKVQVQREIRGYIALEKFIKETKNDGQVQFSPYDKIMIMVELTNKPKLREWVGWDDSKEDFNKKKNLKRFFSWITPTYDYDEESEEYVPSDPIIISHKEVRDLEEIIDDEEALEYMEEQKSIKFALEQNAVFTKKQFSKTIKNVEKILRNVKTGSSHNLGADEKNNLKKIISYCQKFLTS